MTLESLLHDAARDVEAVVAGLEVPVLGHRSPRSESWRWWRRGLALAVVGAAVVAVAMLLPLLIGPLEPRSVPLVDDLPVTTTTLAPTTTILETTTIVELPAYVPHVVWSMVESPAFDIPGEAFDILVTDGMVYAAGAEWSGELNAAAIWRSQNGADWERILDPAFAGDGNFQIAQLAHYSNTLVAVGLGCSADWTECGPAVWVSEGGEVWERLGPDDMEVFGKGGRGLSSVITTETGFLAGGTGLWTSPDGRNWTRLFEGSSAYEIRQILQAPSQILAVGVNYGNFADALVLRSTDSANWEEMTIPHPDQAGWLYEVTDTSEGFVAVGAVGPMDQAGFVAADAAVWLSPDGVEWTHVEDAPTVLGGGRGEWMQRVIAVDDLVVSVGTMINSSWTWGRGVVWESEDGGKTWARESGPEFGRDHRGYTSIFDMEMFESALIATGQHDEQVTVWIGVVDN